jgi:hypothetical protein
MVEPRHHTPRSDRPTRGAQVAVLARAKGRPLMPHQAAAADVALEVDPDTGLYWYGIVVMSFQRQAGKTKLEGDVADHRCLTTPRARVWITQQTGKDASAWMRDEHFDALAQAAAFGTPGTPGCRYRVSKRAGQEGVTWPGPPMAGSTFRVFPPMRDALHGKQSDLVYIDEAWSLTAEQGGDVRQAIRPTMATRRGAQLWVVSTRGDDASVFFDDYLQLGVDSLTTPDTRVAFIDYGIPDDADADDLDVIAAHHPAYGHTIDRAALEAARQDFGADVSGWARAYGNRATRTRTAAFPPGVWEACGTERVPIPARVGFGFDVHHDRVSVVAAWREVDPAGRPRAYLEALEQLPTADAPAVLSALARRYRAPLGYDTLGAATLDLADRLARDRTVRLHGLSMRDTATACTRLDREVTAGTIAHFRQPPLDEAVLAAVRRPVLDGGFVWARKHSTGNTAPLVAATVALRTFDQLPAPHSYAIVAGAS